MECRAKLCIDNDDSGGDGGVSLTRACVSDCVPVMFYLCFDFFVTIITIFNQIFKLFASQ